ncbi:MAG: leucyl aminopeptidase [Deltaproteobacteria bacterium]|nr:leucyl aminopeptidase [Deltaproteobacteria bacterium]
MELRFVAPSLRALDLAGTEVLVAPVATDVRPPRGVAGLVDYRLAGRISHLVASGFVSGRAGEVVMVPGRPRLPFDKILLLGEGPDEELDEPRFRALVLRLLELLEGLRARTAVVQLPGRAGDRIPPERATLLLLELAREREAHDLWTLIEPAEAQRRAALQAAELRRQRRAE